MNDYEAVLSSRGALMDDAMIISCGHSVGNAGRRRVMETVSFTLLPSQHSDSDDDVRFLTS